MNAFKFTWQVAVGEKLLPGSNQGSLGRLEQQVIKRLTLFHVLKLTDLLTGVHHNFTKGPA